MKLNPSLADAWLSLGNCIWKKGDLVSAKNCFTLGLSKVIFFNPLILMEKVKLCVGFLVTAIEIYNFQGPHKGLLCQLSMLERRMAQGKIQSCSLL